MLSEGKVWIIVTALVVQSDVPFRDIVRQLETIFIVVLNNNILQNTGCYFIPEDFHTRSVLLHCKSFCLQTFWTQFSHGESELLLDNQEVTSAKTTSSNMSLERENFIQDLYIFYSFEVCLISDVI